LFLSRKPGHRAPVFGTSMGRAYIAFATDAERERAFEFARRSADPWDQIAHDGVRAAADLQVVRRQGFAVMDLDYSKREYGGSVTTIGVPVLLGDRAVASLTVMFLRETVDQEEAERKLVPAAKDAADEISTALAASR
jgi:IclR family mhp operon transcriptional activator